jgi:ribosomal protein L7Ae-like RNA K-turn-binding protein
MSDSDPGILQDQASLSLLAEGLRQLNRSSCVVKDYRNVLLALVRRTARLVILAVNAADSDAAADIRCLCGKKGVKLLVVRDREFLGEVLALASAKESPRRRKPKSWDTCAITGSGDQVTSSLGNFWEQFDPGPS